uniref:Nucleoside diphosphate kinase homolog 5 n=2 Tax=Cacopsylla melanoneura TaxID=428564 RepID=A0A8D8ZCU0_9HEMI
MAARVLEEEDYLQPEYELEEEGEGEAISEGDEDEVPPPVVRDLRNYEYTLALVKPHAICHVPDIEKIIQEKGFTIIKRKTLKLTPEQATEFLIKREERDPVKVPELICNIVSGFIHVMVLAKEKAIKKWQHLLGPADPAKARYVYPLSLRAKYGEDGIMNALYGSRNQEEAARDIRFFFKDIIIEPSRQNKVSLKDACEPSNVSFLTHKVYLQENIYPTLQKGLAELVRFKPAHGFHWFINWLFENDPHSPKVKPCELHKIPN